MRAWTSPPLAGGIPSLQGQGCCAVLSRAEPCRGGGVVTAWSASFVCSPVLYPYGPKLPLHAPLHPRLRSRPGKPSLPWTPPAQLLEGLHGCAAFSMMQAVCPLGRGYRRLAGPARLARPLPRADSRRAPPCAGAHHPPQPVTWGEGLAGGTVPPEALPMTQAWLGFDVRAASNSPVTSRVALGRVP